MSSLLCESRVSLHGRAEFVDEQPDLRLQMLAIAVADVEVQRLGYSTRTVRVAGLDEQLQQLAGIDERLRDKAA
jgi:hypothetical protein